MTDLREPNAQKYCSWCGSEVTYRSEWASSCPSCGFSNYINPKPCNGNIIFHDGKVLMTRRAMEPGLGKYDLPGGFADIADKTLEEASYRELHEELGLNKDDLGPPRYVGSGAAVYPWHNTKVYVLGYFFAFELLTDPDSIELIGDENTEIIWITRDDLPNIDFAWDSDKQILEKYFEEMTNGSTDN